MKTVGIIAEYDPFHNGHKYQIDYARNVLGAEAVVVVMSGDFTQRGEPALLDKYSRAKMAVKGGADLVIMMPVAFSTSSAEYFALSGVSLLEATGLVTDLVFGAETDDIEEITEAAAYLSSETREFQIALAENLSCGMTFAKARAEACDPAFRDLLSKPNNILAIEYVKALHKLSSSIIPHVHARQGASYDGQTISEHYASASYLRRQLLSSASPESLTSFLPEYAIGEIKRKAEAHLLLSFNDTYHWFLYKSIYDKMLGNPYRNYADLSDDLANRMLHWESMGEITDMKGLLESLKSRNFTRTYISRAISHYLLNIKDEDRCNPAPYLRILDFNECGRQLMKQLQGNASVPFFANINDALKRKDLPAEARKMLDMDIYAADLYTRFLMDKSGLALPTEREKRFFPG